MEVDHTMGIIDSARTMPKPIARSRKELLEQQKETVECLYEHKAITEPDYRVSIAWLERQLKAAS